MPTLDFKQISEIYKKTGSKYTHMQVCSLINHHSQTNGKSFLENALFPIH